VGAVGDRQTVGRVDTPFSFSSSIEALLLLATLHRHRQQARHRQRATQPRHELIRTRGMNLSPIQGTEKRSVRETIHPSSPSSSSARIAATFASVNTRFPQIARRRAAKSGFTGCTAASGRHAVRTPMGCPEWHLVKASFRFVCGPRAQLIPARGNAPGRLVNSGASPERACQSAFCALGPPLQRSSPAGRTL
jgi:hypothetical protein